MRKIVLMAIMLIVAGLALADPFVFDGSGSILDWFGEGFLEKVITIVISLAAGWGINFALGWKFSREVGEMMIAIANAGEGTGKWSVAWTELQHIIALFKSKKPGTTTQALKRMHENPDIPLVKAGGKWRYSKK